MMELDMRGESARHIWDSSFWDEVGMNLMNVFNGDVQ
jgi:hypothetical protein